MYLLVSKCVIAPWHSINVRAGHGEDTLMSLPNCSAVRDDTSAQLLEAAVAQSFNAVVITNAEMQGGGPVITYCNPAFCSMTGYSREELLGLSPRVLQGPDTDAKVIERLRQCLIDGRFFQGSAVNYRKGGTPYHVSWNISAVRDEGDEITHFVSVQQDVTHQVMAERERDLMAQALNIANAPVLITDRSGRMVFVNRAFEHQTGYAASEVLGHTPAILRSGVHTPQFYAELRDALVQGENFSRTFVNRRKDGGLYHAAQSISALRDPTHRITHYVSISKDISDLVQREQELREQAYRDGLTGLLNRSAGKYELDGCQTSAERHGASYAVIMCDIDLFKQVNDQHGHEVGDHVLQQVAQALRLSVRATDHVVRWGGEEFLLILPGAGLASAQQLAERIRSAIATQVFPGVGSVTMSSGVGAWNLGETPVDLLRRVDMALYAAKGRGRNLVALATKP